MVYQPLEVAVGALKKAHSCALYTLKKLSSAINCYLIVLGGDLAQTRTVENGRKHESGCATFDPISASVLLGIKDRILAWSWNDKLD